MKKSILLSIAIIGLSLNSSCSIKETNITNNLSVKINQDKDYNIKLGENNNSIKLNINNSEYSKKLFSTKVNVNGAAPKRSSDIRSYKVYIVKANTNAGFPSGGDPMGNIAYGPFDVNVDSFPTTKINFTGIGDSGTEFYYFAIRAYDGINGTGNELIKDNNGTELWTPVQKVAVSSTGVSVDSSLVVTPSSTLTVTPNLIDATGSISDIQISLLGLLTVPQRSLVQSYKINLCTDPTKPIDTKLLTNSIVLNKNQANLSVDNKHSMNLSNIPSGIYYVTAEAYDNTLGTGNLLGFANNNNTPYSNPDSGAKIAVSENKLFVNQDQQVNFIPNNKLFSDVNFTLAIIDEFQVNTYTTDIQSNHGVASDSVGNFVVTWQSGLGSSYDIYAQRYNSNGVAQGSEFRVNTYTTNKQISPSIAMDSTGNFVVTWQSLNQASGGSIYDIYAQRYNSNGVPQSTEFLVNTFTTYSQNQPSIANDSTGNFVITWKSNQPTGGPNYDIYAQRYNSNGVPQSTEFLVNTYTTDRQNESKVAMDSTGNFVITWNSPNQASGSSGYDIYAQRYNSSGVTQGSEFRVNTYTTNPQRSSSIGMDLSGNFIVTWRSLNQASGGSQYDIYAQRYNSSGLAQSTEFIVNTYTTSFQSRSNVSMDSTGDFVITWQSNNQAGASSGYDIYAQKYNGNGVAQGTEFLVNTSFGGQQQNPSIAMDLMGNFVTVWNGQGQGAESTGIFSKRYNKNGFTQ